MHSDFFFKQPSKDREDGWKKLKTVDLGGKRNRSSAYVKDEDGEPLMDVELIRER